MQPALDVRSSLAPALARPVLATRNGDQLPVRPVAPVSPFKRIVGQADSRLQIETPRAGSALPESALKGETLSTAVATVQRPSAAPVSSSPFLAQRIAQENQGESRPSNAKDEVSIAAYRAAAERGAIFFGLEYPVDFSV